jgi:hypothetical protein
MELSGDAPINNQEFVVEPGDSDWRAFDAAAAAADWCGGSVGGQIE